VCEGIRVLDRVGQKETSSDPQGSGQKFNEVLYASDIVPHFM
jgi:hypothetical protein